MSSRPRRHSSEYSAPSASTSHSQGSKQIQVNEEEKKQARSTLYSVLFKNWKAKAGILPSLISGAVPILTFLVFGDILNAIQRYALMNSIANSFLSGAPKPSDLMYMGALFPGGINTTLYNYSTIGMMLKSKIEDPMPDIEKYALYMAGIAVIAGIAKFFDVYLWIRVGSELSTQIRKDLFMNMMKSEVTFFDVNPIGGILTLLSEDAQMVQDSFGHVKGTQIANLAQFLVGISLAYIYSWKLALIATGTLPVIGLAVFIFIPGIMKHSSIRFQHLGKSMTIAEETLSSIRTVRGYNREDKELERFDAETQKSADHEKSIGTTIVWMMMIVMACIWSMVIYNLNYGSKLVDESMKGDGSFQVGDLMSVFGFCMFGCFGILQLQGSLQGEQKAIAAGARILKLSTHVPTVAFEGGIEPEDFRGHIKFENVTFRYPTRPVDVLINVSFEVPPGSIAALVGHSGSGKSTCVQLLERYYDVSEGVITIDGRPIQDYNPRWLHRKMGLVSQEPTLFRTTIKENIKYGAPNATDAEVEAAAETANAKRFIDKMEKKFETMVGEKGASLSGGQRQRVAIARAVIKNPVILVTDEATSALDASSEKKVQTALDQVMKGRTAVLVAHRLSTIRNANTIYVFDAGKIMEQGTHDELVAKHGVYYNLVERQLATFEKEIEKQNLEKDDEERSSNE